MSEVGNSIQQAAQTVIDGGVLVYPTEGVFGLGCDYRNQGAVEKLLDLKQREMEKGLVLIASHIQHVLPLIRPARPADLARALKTWPGHHTWVFPKTEMTPTWISGAFPTVAVRVSAHPVVKALCDQLGMALVSTSANLSGQATADNCQSLYNTWGTAVDYYLDCALGGAAQASGIRLASDGSVIR